MPSKSFALDSLGSVTVTKRRSNRHLRITLAPDGEIRVSIPSWAPYQSGLDFALSKQPWIESKRPLKKPLGDGQMIGKSHRLCFTPDSNLEKPKSRINGNTVNIIYPLAASPDDTSIQKLAETAIIKALRKQAESLLPQRMSYLSQKYQLEYSSLKVKQMSRRWGSCSQNKDIVLNLFLIQLSWELIDYVIMHELTHTKQLNHSPKFWSLLESYIPNTRLLKKELSKFHPAIIHNLT